MGSNSDVRSFEAPNEAAALKIAKQIIEDSRYSDGHEYSGCIGMAQGVVVHRTPKPVTEKKAGEIMFGVWKPTGEFYRDRTGKRVAEKQPVGAKCKKWGPAVLIRVKNKGSRKARWMLGAECAS